MEPNSNLTTNVNPSIDDVFDIVANIVSDIFGIEKDEVKMDTLLEKDLGADGLDIVEFVMTLEAEFGIVLPDEIFIPHELIEDGDECEEDETEDEEEWEDEECEEECEDGEEDVQFEPYTLTIADFVSFIHASLNERSAD